MNPFYDIGKRIYSLRTSEGWTQQELASKLNGTRYSPDVKQPHIAGLEKSKGERLPSVPVLAALAEVFGVSMQDIVGVDVFDAKSDLLKGLRAEDRALVRALISRLRQDCDLDAEWLELSDIATSDLDIRDAINASNKVGHPVN